MSELEFFQFWKPPQKQQGLDDSRGRRGQGDFGRWQVGCLRLPAYAGGTPSVVAEPRGRAVSGLPSVHGDRFVPTCLPAVPRWIHHGARQSGLQASLRSQRSSEEEDRRLVWGLPLYLALRGKSNLPKSPTANSDQSTWLKRDSEPLPRPVLCLPNHQAPWDSLAHCWPLPPSRTARAMSSTFRLPWRQALAQPVRW